MEMLIEVVAAVLLLLGSGMIFHALLALDREPVPLVRTAVRHVPAQRTRRLPRAA